ncbi:hypothetical protein KUM42_06570 [Modestobacter sp. L9-4]|uniref:hypothetical protein n=1 Tax=Modestobacter sp. L9-4 TaxID=2851567 RepID=UPI001C778830|nr:hypothetical protein [Modestobacter sp. L9-4]QXG77176.1 hypothetical protein KUM42_06570 [Modestobacter sp. L9-4]
MTLVSVLVLAVVAAAVLLGRGDAPGTAAAAGPATSTATTTATATAAEQPSAAAATSTAPRTTAATTSSTVVPAATASLGPTEIPTAVATDRPDTAAPGSADVVITYAGWDAGTASVEVNAFVSGVIEDGGTCTATLTLGSTTRTVTAPAAGDATTTGCAPMIVTGDQLSAGDWQAVVSYTSATAEGRSPVTGVSVP